MNSAFALYTGTFCKGTFPNKKLVVTGGDAGTKFATRINNKSYYDGHSNLTVSYSQAKSGTASINASVNSEIRQWLSIAVSAKYAWSSNEIASYSWTYSPDYNSKIGWYQINAYLPVKIYHEKLYWKYWYENDSAYRQSASSTSYEPTSTMPQFRCVWSSN